MTNLKTLHWTALDQVYAAVRRELRSRGEWRHGADRVHEVAKEGFNAVGPVMSPMDRVFCDLGCGVYHPFGVSAVMFLNGARGTLGLDLHRADPRRAAEALFELLSDCLMFPDRWHWSPLPREVFLERIRRFNLQALRDGNLAAGIDGLPLLHLISDIHSPLLKENLIDVMTSRAVLEHFLDFPTAARRMWSLLRPGGVAFHLIDLVDHRAYKSSDYHFWSFLSEDDQWSDGDVNRLRASELRACFEQAGFEILRYDTEGAELPAGFRTQLAGRFRQMSDADLSVTTVRCLLRRPN